MSDRGWLEDAACGDKPLMWFFEGFENSAEQRRETRALCMSCPVIAECFAHGTSYSETGVYGGVYLINGDVAEDINSDADATVWRDIRELLV